jgi:hypothetical protein
MKTTMADLDALLGIQEEAAPPDSKVSLQAVGRQLLWRLRLPAHARRGTCALALVVVRSPRVLPSSRACMHAAVPRMRALLACMRTPVATLCACMPRRTVRARST